MYNFEFAKREYKTGDDSIKVHGYINNVFTRDQFYPNDYLYPQKVVEFANKNATLINPTLFLFIVRFICKRSKVKCH